MIWTRVSHGMVLGSNNEKMSKSKGNVINPDDIVKEYGADTLRVYEMFMGDYEQDAPWSTDSLRGCKRFVEKVIRLKDKLNNLEGVGESIVVEREGKLIGLVFPDEQTTNKFSLEEIENMMRENLAKLNKLIPGYSRVSDIEIKDEPFEKTPKKSIKRFLYK